MARIQNYKRVNFVSPRKRRKPKNFSPKDTLYVLIIVIALGVAVERGYSAFSNQLEKKVTQLVKQETQTTQVQAYEDLNPVDYSSLSVVDVVEEDPRVIKLREFLTEKNSPLASYAQLIVKQADKYDIGWTKIVAISSIESNYGKRIKKDSHNAWGIMIGGSVHSFDSWEEGIEYTSKLLGKNYKELEVEAIKSRYCPSEDCHGEWVEIVLASKNEILE